MAQRRHKTIAAHPGEILRTEFLQPMGISVYQRLQPALSGAEGSSAMFVPPSGLDFQGKLLWVPEHCANFRVYFMQEEPQGKRLSMYMSELARLNGLLKNYRRRNKRLAPALLKLRPSEHIRREL